MDNTEYRERVHKKKKTNEYILAVIIGAAIGAIVAFGSGGM